MFNRSGPKIHPVLTSAKTEDACLTNTVQYDRKHTSKNNNHNNNQDNDHNCNQNNNFRDISHKYHNSSYQSNNSSLYISIVTTSLWEMFTSNLIKVKIRVR